MLQNMINSDSNIDQKPSKILNSCKFQITTKSVSLLPENEKYKKALE
jgi:hypothetical protein